MKTKLTVTDLFFDTHFEREVEHVSQDLNHAFVSKETLYWQWIISYIAILNII
jgi:hypothetical protein